MKKLVSVILLGITMLVGCASDPSVACPEAGEASDSGSQLDGGTVRADAVSYCTAETYDVDGNPTNGCEILDFPQGNHSQATATYLGTNSVWTAAGQIPSDARVHIPAATGFNSITGSAPDWFRMTPGVTSSNLLVQFRMTNSLFPSCYQMKAVTDLGSFTCNTNVNGYCSISGLRVAAGSSFYLSTVKTCTTAQREIGNYTVSANL